MFRSDQVRLSTPIVVAQCSNKQYDCSITSRELFYQPLKLFGGKNVFVAKTLLWSPHVPDWIKCEPLMSDSVVLQCTQCAL